MSNIEDDYSNKIKAQNLGADFKAFKTSNVGAHLIKCAERDEIAALKILATASPEDTDLIRKLQFDAAVPARLLQWIEQVINAGESAKFELNQEDKGY